MAQDAIGRGEEERIRERGRGGSKTRAAAGRGGNELGLWMEPCLGRCGLYSHPPTVKSNGWMEREGDPMVIKPLLCRSHASLFSRGVPRVALWAKMASQERHYGRAVPGKGTMRGGLSRVWAMLFPVVLGRPIVFV